MSSRCKCGDDVPFSSGVGLGEAAPDNGLDKGLLKQNVDVR